MIPIRNGTILPLYTSLVDPKEFDRLKSYNDIKNFKLDLHVHSDYALGKATASGELLIDQSIQRTGGENDYCFITMSMIDNVITFEDKTTENGGTGKDCSNNPEYKFVNIYLYDNDKVNYKSALLVTTDDKNVEMMLMDADPNTPNVGHFKIIMDAEEFPQHMSKIKTITFKTTE